jgi:hypothetical protein
LNSTDFALDTVKRLRVAGECLLVWLGSWEHPFLVVLGLQEVRAENRAVAVVKPICADHAVLEQGLGHDGLDRTRLCWRLASQREQLALPDTCLLRVVF